jgi:PIN domain nuclease of toxin-antitoxin system
MRLLLDSNIIIALTRRRLAALPSSIQAAVADEANDLHASAASLWEIAIKTRLGKLDPGLPVVDLPGYLQTAEVALMSVSHHHAVALLNPEPNTRDPFDRLLLAQCAVEGLQLITVDRALLAHPLAWRPT